MPIESRYIHTLVIERAVAGAPDEYGQPVLTWTPIATVPGLVLPKGMREVALLSQGGATIADSTIYLAPRDLPAADRVRLSPDDGRVFELTAVRDELGHHLKCDARVVS